MAGRWVLLAGAILQTAWAVFLVWYSTGWQPGLTLYVLGSISVAGVAFAVVANLRASAGHAKQAMVLGIMAAFLPPVQAVTLVGAILCGTLGSSQETHA